MVRVLCVEDDLDVARHLKTVIEADPATCISVDTAHNLAEAREKLKGFSYECIVLDVHLPNGRGAEVIQKIRESAPLLPLVVVSGFTDIVKVEAIMSGAQEFLAKPVKARQIIDAIATAIARQKVRTTFVPLREMEETVAEMKRLSESVPKAGAKTMPAV